MGKKEIIQQIENLVRRELEGEGSGHDWWHIHRVRTMALKLCKHHEADPFITEIAALLHDIADHKFHNGDDTIGPEVAGNILSTLDVNPDHILHVKQIIHEVSFKGADVDTPVSSPESAVVQDADRLDAIGAIGIARAFAYGGYRERPLFVPDIEPERHQSFEDYKRSESHTINHFYEKLLLLKDRLNTQKAKEIAQKRHEFMESYLNQFKKEWNAEL